MSTEPRPPAAGAAAAQGSDPGSGAGSASDAPAPIVLGFARGIAPSKWERRWIEATGRPIELRPVSVTFGPAPSVNPRDPDAAPIDVMLERTGPGARPAGSGGEAPTRHALRLYGEAIALVLPADHDLAERESISPAEIQDLTASGELKLLDHPDHASQWPAPEAWADPSWKPAHAAAALRLVAAGTGGILLPLPLSRHLSDKRSHALVPVHGDPALAPTEVWATWAIARDAADVQQLVGILRGRTARSSRPGADADSHQGGGSGPGSGSAEERRAAKSARAQQKSQAKPKAKAGPKPGTRGAQLANAKWKPKPPRPKPKRRS